MYSKLLILALLVLSLAACGKQEYIVEDDALRPSVEKFFDDCARYGTSDDRYLCANPGRVTIRTAERMPNPKEVGYSDCRFDLKNRETCEIVILKKASGTLLDITVYHELGHAVLGKPHVFGKKNCSEIMFTHGKSCTESMDWKKSVLSFWSTK